MLENEETDQNYKIYAFIYLSENTAGNTEHKITIPVKARPKPEVPGTPGEPELFRKAVEAVSEAAGRAERAQEQAEAWTHGHEKHPECDTVMQNITLNRQRKRPHLFRAEWKMERKTLIVISARKKLI